MAKMNWNQSRGGDDDFAAVGEEPTIAARYRGTCATCGQPFAVGDPIASVIVDKKPTYHHGGCRYPATALLSQNVTEADVDAVEAATSTPKPGKCRATTNKGKPCNNAPQKGEQFCGPHLTQLAARDAWGSPSDRRPVIRRSATL
jgi:hypothetical protein